MKKYVLGIALSFGMAAVSIILGNWFPLIGSSVFAIVLGILLSNFLKIPDSFQPGLTYSGKKLLQYSIIFLGFSMSIGIPAYALTMSQTVVIPYFFAIGQIFSSGFKSPVVVSW